MKLIFVSLIETCKLLLFYFMDSVPLEMYVYTNKFKFKYFRLTVLDYSVYLYHCNILIVVFSFSQYSAFLVPSHHNVYQALKTIVYKIHLLI